MQDQPDSSLAAGPVLGAASSETSADALRPPSCIIDWSDQVARAEEDHARAVTVNVISDDLLARIDVDANSLVLRKASSSSYLLVLPELALVDRLVGLRQPVSSSGFNFSLLCKRWSRLTGAQGHVLPFLIDIELRGIPNHIWETSTVDRL